MREKMTRPLWQLLMLLREPDASIELSCIECFELLEYDADRLVAGAEPAAIRPSVRQHLALCSSCQNQIDDWLEKLEVDKKSSK